MQKKKKKSKYCCHNGNIHYFFWGGKGEPLVLQTTPDWEGGLEHISTEAKTAPWTKFDPNFGVLCIQFSFLLYFFLS